VKTFETLESRAVHLAVDGTGFGDRLWREVYAELRVLAARRIARLAPGQSLCPTLLVHEVFLRLHGDGASHYSGRTHFLAVAARAMRFAVVDYLRGSHRIKRGGERKRVPVSQVALGRPDRSFELLELEEALTRLEHHNLRAAEVVTLRFFAGMTTSEISGELGTSTATVERDWRYARAWLHRELSPPSASIEPGASDP
jgi:RNA polymerase sigma factor (TIGR02999 family)